MRSGGGVSATGVELKSGHKLQNRGVRTRRRRSRSRPMRRGGRNGTCYFPWTPRSGQRARYV